MSRGICKLTNKTGKFVKSHLLPRALTRPSFRGNRFIQVGLGLRPKTVWSSWYDKQLVIREGEKVLSSYDGWAIQELSRLELIWQSWGPETSLEGSIVTSPDHPSFGLRRLVCENPAKLRLFFLSLLWRAAATDRVEFRDIQLSNDDLSRLQRMVRDGDPDPLDFYPTSLLQIVSRGPTHNLAPIAIDKTFNLDDGTTIRRNVFRFYFDGLIANTYRSITNTKELEPFIVGGANELVVQTQLIDDSFQLANLTQAVGETVEQWPDTLTP